MATVTYKCDTCGRTADIVNNPTGVDVTGRCVITNGCKGWLHQKSFNRYANRLARTESVVGIQDWEARKAFFSHTQSINSYEWTIPHKLGSIPVVDVFTANSSTGMYVRRTLDVDYTITATSLDEVVVTFMNKSGNVGIAHCLSPSTAFTPVGFTPIVPVHIDSSTVELLQVTTSKNINTGNNTLTFASTSVNVSSTLEIVFVSPVDGSETPMLLTDTLIDSYSPWFDHKWISTGGKSYTIRSVSLTDEFLTFSQDFYEEKSIDGVFVYFKQLKTMQPCSVVLSDRSFEATNGLLYKTGQPVYLKSTGDLPAPLIENTPYYVITTGLSNNIFKLATSLKSALSNIAIDITSVGSGDLTFGASEAFAPRDSYILLTMGPGFSKKDIIFDRLIDMSVATSSNEAIKSFIISQEEIHAFGDKVKNVYPPIQTAS